MVGEDNYIEECLRVKGRQLRSHDSFSGIESTAAPLLKVKISVSVVSVIRPLPRLFRNRAIT